MYSLLSLTNNTCRYVKNFKKKCNIKERFFYNVMFVGKMTMLANE